MTTKDVALLIPADEDQPIRPITWTGDDRKDMSTLYEVIDCSYVEVVTLTRFHSTDELTMWKDEDGGMAANAVPNVRASYLTVLGMMVGQPVVGNVVITGGAAESGRTLPLSEDAQSKIYAEFNQD